MRLLLSSLIMTATLVCAGAAHAAQTAKCADGTTSSAKTEKGACSRHGGVKEWYGASAAPAPASAPAPMAKAESRSTSAGTASGASAQCADGSYSRAATQERACTRHGGVKTWMGKTTPAASPSNPPPMPSANPGAPRHTVAGATALCADGSSSRASTIAGACSKHGGVKTWMGATASPAQPPSVTPYSRPPVPAAVPAPTTSSTPATRPATYPATPRGNPGNGTVWVNLKSKVYHCSTDSWYGKTKMGAYMSEPEATAKGYRPEKGKPCN